MNVWLLTPRNGARSVKALEGQSIGVARGSYMHRYVLGLYDLGGLRLLWAAVRAVSPCSDRTQGLRAFLSAATPHPSALSPEGGGPSRNAMPRRGARHLGGLRSAAFLRRARSDARCALQLDF